MREFAETIERLCEASRKDYANPYLLSWPEELSKEQWFFSPELISLHGTPFYEALNEQERKRLSFYEAVNFFSLNIHGEKALMEGLARRLYSQDPATVTPYLHHFLDEENKHMIYFAGFCERYAGKIYPDRKIAFPGEYAEGEEDFLFFAKVLIFEEIVDLYNIRMSLDQRLVPIARQINMLHHHDEARHLVFGRQFVKDLFSTYASSWSSELLQHIRNYLSSFVVETWKEYYNPDIYRDAGFENPYQTYEATWENPHCRLHRKQISAGCVQYLLDAKILEREPSL